MADAFSDFLEDPTEVTFGRIREIVMSDPGYDFHADDVAALDEQSVAGDHAEVLAAVPGMMPGWLLSPRTHLLAAYSAEQTGDAEAARWENYVARACLRGLLRSGDGSRERPYLVTHVADEYDLLDQLGKEPGEVRQVVTENGALDVITCSDGSELWFDATPSLSAAE
jgi:hypothetical protein